MAGFLRFFWILHQFKNLRGENIFKNSQSKFPPVCRANVGNKFTADGPESKFPFENENLE